MGKKVDIYLHNNIVWTVVALTGLILSLICFYVAKKQKSNNAKMISSIMLIVIVALVIITVITTVYEMIQI